MSLRSVSKLVSPLGLVCAVALSCGTGRAEPAGPEPASGATGVAEKPREKSLGEAITEEVRALFAKSRDAVVRVEAIDKEGILCGTGFFIDPNGTLITSYSVGGESSHLFVQAGENRYPARRLVADPRSGIAFLKIEYPATEKPDIRFLPLARKGSVEVASPVMIVAYPLNRPVTPSLGLVAGFDRSLNNRYFATTHLRVNIPVHRGEGGAPLLNMNGEVVGVVISALDGGASCYSLPVEAAWKVYHDYVRYGEVRPGWLGVIVAESAAPLPNESTAEIAGIEEDGPAVHSGLQTGDILQKIGDCEIKAPEDVINASFYLSEGEKVKVTVLRDRREKVEIEIVPVERPGSGKRKSGLFAIPFGSEDITLRTGN